MSGRAPQAHAGVLYPDRQGPGRSGKRRLAGQARSTMGPLRCPAPSPLLRMPPHGDWTGAAASAISAIPFGHLPGVGKLGGTTLKIAEGGGAIERGGNAIHRLSDVELSDSEIRARFEDLQAYRESSPHVPRTLTGDGAVDGVTALLEGNNGRYGYNGWIRNEGERFDNVVGRHEQAGFKPNRQTPTHAEGDVFDQALRAGEKGPRDCLSILQCVLHAIDHSRGF